MRFKMVRWLGQVSFVVATIVVIGPLSAAELEPDATDTMSLTLQTEAQSDLRIVDQSKDAVSSVRPASEPADKNKAVLKPIPAKETLGMARIEAASFNGVTPGKTTLKELQMAWGAPKEVNRQKDVQVQLYSIQPFDLVEVALYDDVVASVIIRLQEAFPAATVAKQLELDDIRPVFVSDELGAVLGQAFPERGVLFAFEPSKKPGKPSMRVVQIILEPIGAEPFVLRAETNLDTMFGASAKDLEKALELIPNNARANWLYARVLVSMGNLKEAEKVGRKATLLAANNPHYQITYAQILSQIGKQAEAKKHAQLGLQNSEKRPHVEAKALCLLGDLASIGIDRDFNQAIEYHTKAIKVADGLADNRHPAVRRAAKEVLINAHLGAASDIAWGDWAKKDVALERWLGQASKFAEDFIATEGGSKEVRFRVAARALAAYAGTDGKLDVGQWPEKALETGSDLVNSTVDPVKKQRLCWELGMALYDALQIYQVRNDHERAFHYGEQAVQYFEQSGQQMRSTMMYNYMLGRLYFRLGAIHAVSKNDHQAAINWFDKAVPILKQPMMLKTDADLGRHGETLVSMGVSYWKVGNQKQGIDLTMRGVAMMEKAAANGSLAKTALAVPYSNLSAMYGQTGDDDTAGQYAKKVTELSEIAVKNTTGTKIR